MKTIHNSYLFTEKDGTPEEILSAVSSLPQEYPAFIVSKDLHFLERTVSIFAKSDLSPQKTSWYKIGIDKNEYFSFLRPKDEHFTNLYEQYVKTDNEIDRVKFLSDMLDSLDGCIAVFSSLPLKKIEYWMKKISDQEESQHPAMHIPLVFIFTTPPFKASTTLTREFEGEPYYKKVFGAFITDSKEWLYSNNEMTMELLKLCSNLRPDPSDQRRTIAENVHITEEIENCYLRNHFDNQDYLKRIKVLAAVNAEISYMMLESAMQSGNVEAVATYMFLLTRSMAQFAANKAVDAGLRQHASRKEGGGKGADRTGLLTLVRRFNEKYPSASSRDLWKILRNFLIKKKRYAPCKGYSVKFQIEPTDMDDTGGMLVQFQSGKETHEVQFQAFTNMLNDIRK